MSNKLLSIRLHGNRRTRQFEFYGDPKHLAEWRADGLEIYEVCNVIPAWIAELGLTRPWCFLQDVFNFKNPWGGR